MSVPVQERLDLVITDHPRHDPSPDESGRAAFLSNRPIFVESMGDDLADHLTDTLRRPRHNDEWVDR